MARWFPALLMVVACTKPNPDFCSSSAECSDGEYCRTEVNRCEPVADAAPAVDAMSPADAMSSGDAMSPVDANVDGGCIWDKDDDGERPAVCGGTDCCDDGTEGTMGCTEATAAEIYPGRLEICGDGIDQDCDGVDLANIDADTDGEVSVACGGSDCCDEGTEASLGCAVETRVQIYAGATEVCGDGIDQNCDGVDPACARGRP